MEQSNQQILQEAQILLEQIKKFSEESGAKLDKILEQMKKVEEKNKETQSRLDKEIEQVADEMDSATIEFANKISE